MLTITQCWLDELPSWYDAGWRIGDTLDLCNYLQNTGSSAKTALANHPPTGPHH